MIDRAGVGRMLRDALVIALVAALTFQALRRWVLDRYGVGSGSMQPLLFGSGQHGDVVVVDKLASARGLRRYDTLVVRHPEDAGGRLVKRVVAFGDDLDRCWVELREGDLWLGPDAQRLSRAVKHPLTSRDLRATWFSWPQVGDDVLEHFLAASTRPVPGSLEPAAGRLWLSPAAGVAQTRLSLGQEARRERREQGLGAVPQGWISTQRAIDGSYCDAYGNRGREGGAVQVLDVGMDFEFVPSAVRDLYCGLDLRPDAWMFHWRPAAGRVELWRNGTTVAEHVLPADLLASRRSASAPVRVEYGFLDARFFFAVDSRADMLWCIDRKPEWMTTDPGSTPWAQPRTRLYVGANASGPVAVPRLAVFRDVHWFRLPALGLDPSRKNASKLVPPGHLYLLGDNSFDSKDSRMFGAVPVRNFAGRPRMVLGPWPRLGWLSR